MTHKTHLDTAVIGAGPYGLSIGAHLQDAGIETRVFGDVMETWRQHVPPGMCLKSYGDSSNLLTRTPNSRYAPLPGRITPRTPIGVPVAARHLRGLRGGLSAALCAAHHAGGA